MGIPHHGHNAVLCACWGDFNLILQRRMLRLSKVKHHVQGPSLEANPWTW